jgi:hypothetical protein
MSFEIKANLNFTTASVPTEPVKPKTDTTNTPVNTEQPSTAPVNKEQKPTAPARIDPDAAEKKAIETIQTLAGQYGVKTGNLSTEEGRAKTVTDMWVKINNNLEKAKLSKDPEALQAATTAKSAFLEQLKGATGLGWNFGLKDLVQTTKVNPQPPAPKPTTPDVTPKVETPTNEQPNNVTNKPQKPVAKTDSVQPTSSAEVQALLKDANALIQDTNDFKASVNREAKSSGSRASNEVLTRFAERASALLERYDSVLRRGKDVQGAPQELTDALKKLDAEAPVLTRGLSSIRNLLQTKPE